VKALIMTKMGQIQLETTIRNNNSTIQIMEIKFKVEIKLMVYNYDKLMLKNIKIHTHIPFYSCLHYNYFIFAK
jgi:hypothetical protein